MWDKEFFFKYIVFEVLVGSLREMFIKEVRNGI